MDMFDTTELGRRVLVKTDIIETLFRCVQQSDQLDIQSLEAMMATLLELRSTCANRLPFHKVYPFRRTEAYNSLGSLEPPAVDVNKIKHLSHESRTIARFFRYFSSGTLCVL